MKIHKHHITPRHLGGTDDPDNLIEVTVEEHAEIHRVLYERDGRWQDLAAWKGLSGQISFRELDEEIAKNRALKISRALSGRVITEETKKKMAQSAKLRANTEEGRERLLSIAGNGKGMKRNDTTKKAISSSLLGKQKSESHKENMRKPKSVKLGWFTNGVNNLKLRLTDTVPENYYRGRTFLAE